MNLLSFYYFILKNFSWNYLSSSVIFNLLPFFGFDINSVNDLHSDDVSSEGSSVMILSVVDLCHF